MEKTSNNIKQIVTQFLLIVFSVVLGLYLSERIEERKQRKESDELLTTIKSEIKDNLSLLQVWVPYHREINKKLDSLSKHPVFIDEFITNKFILLEKLLTKGTFMGRTPISDAWDIAKSHPLVVNIDYDKWVIISRIYNQQETTFKPAFEMIALFETKDVNVEKDAKANLEVMSNYFRELVAREDQLMFYYKQAEEILDLSDKKELNKVIPQ
ncbi:MAG: hypothetical protein AAFO07_03070 [Bacteroidota bacterium]